VGVGRALTLWAAECEGPGGATARRGVGLRQSGIRAWNCLCISGGRRKGGYSDTHDLRQSGIRAQLEFSLFR
jgi:hypothetical protein